MGDQQTRTTDARRAGDDFMRAMASMTEVVEENTGLKAKIEEMKTDHEAEVAALTLQRDSFERAAAIAQREHEALERQHKAMKGERDHYFRCYTALKSGLGGVAAQILEQIKTTDIAYYGERREIARPQGEPELRGAPRPPRFLRPPDNEMPAQPQRATATG